MDYRKIGLALVGAVLLAGCQLNDTERAVAGAAAGAVVSDAIGGSAVAGAVVGGAAGAYCDNAGLC